MSDELLNESLGKPRCIAIVICNEIIEDKLTNNKTLVSLFNTLAAPHLPYVHPRMFIMASLSHGEGEWSLAIGIRSPDGSELLRAENRVKFTDPADVLDIVIEVRDLPLDEEGVYYADVSIGEGLAASRQFAVIAEH